MSSGAPERRIVAKGVNGVVEFAIDARGRSRARTFLDGLPEELGASKNPNKQGIGDKAKAKFLALFKEMVDAGEIRKESKFGKESGGIYAFKYEIVNHLIRIPCFQFKGSWVLTHGFYKKGAQRKKGKWRREEIITAETIMAEHTSRFA
jgi:hypothetical protein